MMKVAVTKQPQQYIDASKNKNSKYSDLVVNTPLDLLKIMNDADKVVYIVNGIHSFSDSHCSLKTAHVTVWLPLKDKRAFLFRSTNPMKRHQAAMNSSCHVFVARYTVDYLSQTSTKMHPETTKNMKEPY